MGVSISLGKRVLAEFIGTLLLLCIVIGSGIMAERLAGCNIAIALLGNTFATVFGIYVPIEIFGLISGAMLGAWLAHAMFDVPIVQYSTKVRSAWGQWIAEVVATGGLLYWCSLLVYSINLICKPRCRIRSHVD
jgi:glycerol uptake facilitator-like aquaporin